MLTPTELKLYSLPGMQEFFREKMGRILYADLLYFPEVDQVGTYGRVLPEHDKFIRLPLPINPVNPERGLWGMIDWNKWEVQIDNGQLYFYETDIFRRESWSTGWLAPTEALLRAIMVQEGIREE